jgi:hypothetical protein
LELIEYIYREKFIRIYQFIIKIKLKVYIYLKSKYNYKMNEIIQSNAPILKFKTTTPKHDQKPEVKAEIKVDQPKITESKIEITDALEQMVIECIQRLQITVLKGEQGEPGVGVEGKTGPRGGDGIQGRSGKDGKDGKPGKNGADGKDGIDGINGKDGEDGRNGLDGADGQRGIPGPPGPPGKTGAPGSSSEGRGNIKTKSTIYVDQKFGNDETAKSENAGLPFKSISKAMKYAKADECIIVAPGNYGVLSLRPGVWIEGSHGLVLFDQIVTSENYKWKKNDAVYISNIAVRSNDKPALNIDRGNVHMNYCNISSIYGHHTNNDAVVCEISNSKVYVNSSTINLESLGSNEMCSMIRATGTETEILMDNDAFEIKRDGNDSLIYTLYNAVKMGNIRISRSDVVIDANDTNIVKMEYTSEDAGVNSEIRGTTLGEKSSNQSYKSTKSDNKWKAPPTSSANNNTTRIVKSDVQLTPTDSFIIITSEQKCNITLPVLTAPKLKELSGNVQSIVYTIKSTKDLVNHQILTSETNRINEFDKNITLEYGKILNIRSVGSDWITY